MQQGERVICEIKRHPVGLIVIYLGVGVVILAAIAAVIFVPHLLTETSQQSKMALAFGSMIFVVMALLYAYIATTIYRANRWIVTTDSITQVTQIGLFRRFSSQLSLANLEDVSVEQNGLFPTMFGYGTIKAESAGERAKFVFPLCPTPNECAKQIIAAHEAYIAGHPEETQVANRAVANAQAFNQPMAPPEPPAQSPQQ